MENYDSSRTLKLAWEHQTLRCNHETNPNRAACVNVHKDKRKEDVKESYTHSSFDVSLRKIPIARGRSVSSVRTALLGKRDIRLHTWRPWLTTAAVYRSHGHICRTCRRRSTIPARSACHLLRKCCFARQKRILRPALRVSIRLSLRLMQSCRRGCFVINIHMIDHEMHQKNPVSAKLPWECRRNVDYTLIVHVIEFQKTNMSSRIALEM